MPPPFDTVSPTKYSGTPAGNFDLGQLTFGRDRLRIDGVKPEQCLDAGIAGRHEQADGATQRVPDEAQRWYPAGRGRCRRWVRSASLASQRAMVSSR